MEKAYLDGRHKKLRSINVPEGSASADSMAKRTFTRRPVRSRYEPSVRAWAMNALTGRSISLNAMGTLPRI